MVRSECTAWAGDPLSEMLLGTARSLPAAFVTDTDDSLMTCLLSADIYIVTAEAERGITKAALCT